MRVLSLLAAVVVAGCANAVIPTAQTVPVPVDRVLAPELLGPRAGTVAVIVKRDTGLTGSACALRLMVDARAVADLRGGERVDLALAPGERLLAVQSQGICGGGTVEVKVAAQGEAAQVYRVGYNDGAVLYFMPTAF